MHLSGHAQAQDHHRFPRRDRGQTLRVNTGGQHLDERRGLVGDHIRQEVQIARRYREVLGKPSIPITSQKVPTGAQVGLTSPAVKTGPTEDHGVDDHTAPRLEPASAAVDHFTDHLVTHDQRMMNRYGALVDLQVCAADAAVGQSNQRQAAVTGRLLNIFQRQCLGCVQHQRLHERDPFMSIRTRSLAASKPLHAPQPFWRMNRAALRSKDRFAPSECRNAAASRTSFSIPTSRM